MYRTHTELRQKYYVCKGRQVVKRLINVSYVESWKRRHLQHHQLQTYLSFVCLIILPSPVVVWISVGLCLSKIYFQRTLQCTRFGLCYFTCASSRAMHLDIVPSLHLQPFICCLHRFFARRGAAMLFISDNVKTFKAKEVTQLLLERSALEI